MRASSRARPRPSHERSTAAPQRTGPRAIDAGGRAMIARDRAAHRWAAARVGFALAAARGRRAAPTALREHPYFAISQIVINGCGRRSTPDDVRAWLGFTSAIELWDARPARVRARLEAHPWIAHARGAARVSRRVLEVVVARARAAGDRACSTICYYVDRSGRVLRPLRPGQPRLPAHHRPRPAACSEGAAHLGAAARAAAAAPLRARALRRRRLRGASRRRPRRGALSRRAPRVPVVLGWGSWPEKLERAGARAARVAGRTQSVWRSSSTCASATRSW